MKFFNKKLVFKLLILFIILEALLLLFGTISQIFLTAEAKAKNIKNECKASNLERCYADKFSELIKKRDLEETVEVLNKLNEVDSASRGCHLIAHVIAIGETEKNPDNWQEVLKKIDVNRCTGGFLHGVIEAHAKNDGAYKITPTTMKELCSIVGEELKGMGKQNCSHIMGHLSLAQEIGDINKAIKICDGADDELQYECYSGVFMENETRENLMVHAGFQPQPWTVANTKKQEKICLEQSGVASVACWREISHMLIVTSDYSSEKLYSACRKAPSEDAFEECYLHGISTLILSDISKRDYSVMCNILEEKELFSRCQSHAIGGLMTSSLDYIDKAISFCDVFENEDKEFCVQRIGFNISLSKEKLVQEKYCNKLPEEFQYTCREVN